MHDAPQFCRGHASRFGTQIFRSGLQYMFNKVLMKKQVKQPKMVLTTTPMKLSRGTFYAESVLINILMKQLVIVFKYEDNFFSDA